MAVSTADLKAPFPWFGGKSRVASLVWERLGNVPNYVEPFFGSGAVLLGRPHDPGIETVNDLDGFVANFWRALQHDPKGLAVHADNPVNENDLHARHIWLVGERDALQSRLEGNPEFYDLKIAGWWVWGIACWIGGGWCSGKGPWASVDGQLVHLGDAGQGVNKILVHLGTAGQGVQRKRVHLGTAGRGVKRKLVHLGDAGQGVKRRLVHLGGAGQGVNRKRVHLENYFTELAERLKNVRVCSGDWSRICGPTPTTAQGLTGMFLDPPYGTDAKRTPDLYAKDCLNVAGDVLAYCIERGNDPLMRIALCGYDGEHNILSDKHGWDCVTWEANGGHANVGNGNGKANKKRERIWFSPNCMQAGLF